jgi:hypothetical protein
MINPLLIKQWKSLNATIFGKWGKDNGLVLKRQYISIMTNVVQIDREGIYT